MSVVIVYGASTPPARLCSLATETQELLAPQVGTDFVDLSAFAPAGGGQDSRDAAMLRAALDAVATSAAVLFFSPVYRASLPGVLKSFIDAFEPAALTAKPVGVVSMGSGHAHQLAIPAAIAPILEWFGALTVPGALYFTDSDFVDGRPTPAVRQRLADFAALTLFLTRQVRDCPTPAAIGPALR